MAHALNKFAVWFDSLDLSCDTSAGTVEAQTEMKDNTTMCDDWRSKVPGLEDGTVSIAMFGDADNAKNIDATYEYLDAASYNIPLTFSPNRGPSAGPAYIMQLVEGSVELNGQVGELFLVTVNGNANNYGVVKGTVMIPKSSPTSTGVGTAMQLGPALATQKLYGILHVFALNATSLDVEINNDAVVTMDDDPTTELTFTQKTAIGSEFVVVDDAGALNDEYWQVSYTLTGGSTTATFAVAFGIQ